jgi:CubicO group peptidase (beta-lactamase class C family)
MHIGQTHANPSDVGVRPEMIDRLDAFFTECVKTTKIQCTSYLLARRGKVFAWKSVGPLSGLEDKGDMQPDSLFGIASITKLLTAVGILQLVEQGKLVLDQPVSSIIKEFDTAIHGGILIHHLLTHTSGMSADPGACTEPYPRPFWNEELNRDNWIKWALQGPLQYPVGRVWNYCTRGFMLLGEIIARVSGMEYAEYIQQHILDPLGMTRSFFLIPDELKDQVCIVNEWDQKELAETYDLAKVTSSWAAGGGLTSTPYDLWKFAQMLLNKGEFEGQRILGRKTMEAMTRNHLYQTPEYNWGHDIRDKQFGLGIEIDKDPLITSPGTLSHEGARWSSLFIDPVEELISLYFQPTEYDFWEHRVMNGARGIVWGGLE